MQNQHFHKITFLEINQNRILREKFKPNKVKKELIIFYFKNYNLLYCEINKYNMTSYQMKWQY